MKANEHTPILCVGMFTIKGDTHLHKDQYALCMSLVSNVKFGFVYQKSSITD